MQLAESAASMRVFTEPSGSFGGLAALLAMLNACAPGITVVNIDNGFGAGVFAARVARRVAR